MNVRTVPRSTARVLNPGNAVNRKEPPSDERRETGKARQRLLSVIQGEGCTACCGQTDIRPREGGAVLKCAVQTNPDFTPEAKAAAEGCQIPALYAAVSRRQRSDVKPEELALEVAALRPDLHATPQPAEPEVEPETVETEEASSEADVPETPKRRKKATAETPEAPSEEQDNPE